MKNKKIEIGTEVWVIEKDLSLLNKMVVAIINEGKEIKYKLDRNSCGGINEKEFSLTEQKAEIKKKNFLDELKFKVGDLVVFEYIEYGNKKKTIGKIVDINYLSNPYKIKGAYKEFNNISDDEILLKVKNEFIENFSNLQELSKEFEEKKKELNIINKLIHDEHENLEKELKQSIKKQYSIFNWNKSIPKFKDRFSYEAYYDDY